MSIFFMCMQNLFCVSTYTYRYTDIQYHSKSIQIYDSEILDDKILIILELGICDLKSWMYPDGAKEKIRDLKPMQIYDIWYQLFYHEAAIHVLCEIKLLFIQSQL